MQIYKFPKENLPLLVEPPFTSAADKKIVHLGEIDGFLYMSVDASVSLNDKIEAVAVSNDELTQIKSKLPVYMTINDETTTAIREKYSLEDELRALRTNDTTYQSAVAQIVAEGKAKKTALGF